MNNIYDYLDYREFLKERFDHLRDTNPNFSYRYFNKKAGLKSSGHIKQIIDGNVGIGRKSLKGICLGLGLSEEEANFFESLVHFNQADAFNVKEKCYSELINKYPAKHPKYLDSKSYKIFTHWYYVAILELVRLSNFRENAHWISKALNPNVPVQNVRQAIDDLIEMELIERNTDGKLVRTEKMVATPEGVRDLSIVKFQQQLSQLAQASIATDRHFDKESSTITLAISDESFKEVKKLLQECCSKIRQVVEENDENAKTSVAHVNLQMFKLAKVEA